MRQVRLRVFLLCLAMMSAVLEPAPSSAQFRNQIDPDLSTPEWMGPRHVGSSEWDELEALVSKLATSSIGGEDGDYQLNLMTASISRWLTLWGDDMDRDFELKFDEYRITHPHSAFRPIVAALQMQARAKRARGTGLAAVVPAERMTLFRERNEKALKMLEAAGPEAQRLPTWYEAAIEMTMDLERPGAEATALLKEGLARFPGYAPLYSSYVRQFSPQWGGTYQQAGRFINEQAAARSGPDGDVLYAQLYWMLDIHGGHDANFIEESHLDWPRARKGFETLLLKSPASQWIKTNFVAFACRAGDSKAYMAWRRSMKKSEFEEVAPEGLSLQSCDAWMRLKA